jgi:hypothetical protein
VWTEDRQRVYALRHDVDTFVVTTTMRASDVTASIPEPTKTDVRRTT